MSAGGLGVLLSVWLCGGVPPQPVAGEWLGPKVPSEVRRVVTIAPSLTETVEALGALEVVVGVSRFDEGKSVAALPRVGGFSDPSIETVVSLKPDLVVVQKAPGNQKPIETLARMGVSVLALPLTTIHDVKQSFIALGAVLGKAAEAKKLVEELDGVRDRMRASGAKRRKPTVLFVYGFTPLIVAGPGGFAHELLEDCGAQNVAARAVTAYPAYSIERVVKLAPEVIVDAAHVKEGKDRLEAIPQLARAKWVVLPSTDLLHPGPTLARGLEVLCSMMASTSN
jgi:iron complex transport system substrate-binding protein